MNVQVKKGRGYETVSGVCVRVREWGVSTLLIKGRTVVLSWNSIFGDRWKDAKLYSSGLQNKYTSLPGLLFFDLLVEQLRLW